MPDKKKILVIACYFGQWPWYSSYFLHSCAHNKGLDYLVFTDQIPAYCIPSNVKIVQTSLAGIIEKGSLKLGFKIRIDHPYKISDFKPAYGLIFSDYTGGYDFWAHSDIDIIYGDIRSFITEKMLQQYDYLSFRHDYCTGCFAVYRNNERVNNIFRNSKDYQKVFTSHNYNGFDELNFKHHLLEDGADIASIETDIECFTHVIRKAEQQQQIKAWFDFILLEGLPGKIKFNKGKIIYKGKMEAALYHLYWLKAVYRPVTVPAKIHDRYNISRTRIYNE